MSSVAACFILGVASPSAPGSSLHEGRERMFSTSGPGLGDVQTAGVVARFTITALDALGIRATSGGDDFIVQAEGPTSVRGAVLDQLDGSYEASYTATRSGDYELTVTAIEQGGLLAEYFENVWLFYAPVRRRVERSVDHSWGREKVTDTASDYVSVRWTGFLRPTYSETVTFYVEVDHGARLLVGGTTLIDCWSDQPDGKAAFGDAQHRGQCVSGASMSVNSGTFYHVRLDYRHLQEDAFAKLLWLSPSITPRQVVPAENLFFPVQGARQSTHSITVLPAAPEGSSSGAYGDMLTVATAGHRALLVINARDAYGNERSSDDQLNGMRLAVRVEDKNQSSHLTPLALASAAEDLARQRPSHASISRGHAGLFHVQATARAATAPGAAANCSSAAGSRLAIHLLHARGVSATYYGGSSLEEPLGATANTATAATADTASPFRMPPVSAQVEAAALARRNRSYVVRWSGFLKSQDPGTYRFSVQVEGASHNFSTVPPTAGSGVRMWIDQALVLDQWTAGSRARGVIVLDGKDTAYSVEVLLRDKLPPAVSTPASSNLTLTLRWNKRSQHDNSCAEGAETPRCAVAAEDLFAGEPVGSSPWALFVKPAPVCAARSSLSYVEGLEGQRRGLTLATAGLASQFYVTARDEYGNLVWSDEVPAPRASSPALGLRVRLSGVDSGMGYVTPLKDEAAGDGVAGAGRGGGGTCQGAWASEGVFKVRYTATRTGTYLVNVAFGTSLVTGAPFRIAVQPAPRHLATSTLSGAALTLTTAGVVSYLSLTVRDAHHNWQPDPHVAQAGLSVSLENEQGSPVSTTMHPFAPGDLPSLHTAGAGGQGLVAAPTTLDNPTLRLNYVVTRSGRYTLRVSGSGAHEGVLSGAPYALRVEPQQICACQSSVSLSQLSASASWAAQGAAFTAATAGVPVRVSIMSRDAYANLVAFESIPNVIIEHGEGWPAPLYTTMLRAGGRRLSSWPASSSSEACAAQVGASCENGAWDGDADSYLADEGGGGELRVAGDHIQATLSGTRAGPNTAIWVRLARAGGLRAAFYLGKTAFPTLSNSSSAACAAAGAAPFLERADPKVEATWAHVLAGNASSSAQGFSARWEGLIRPSVSGVYSFSMGRADSVYGGERLRLWIDNRLIIDQWTSLSNISHHTMESGAGRRVVLPSGAASLRANTYHDIRIAWKEDLGGMPATHVNTSVRLLWKVPSCSASGQVRGNCSNSSNQSGAVPAAMLYSATHVHNSPLHLPIRPASLCASLSTVHGSALSIATAGLAASFELRTRDAFGNMRDEAAGPDIAGWAFNVVPHGSLPQDPFLQPDASPQIGANSSNSSLGVSGGRSGSEAINHEPANMSSSVVYEGGGQYQVTYLVTASGVYQMSGRALSAGGLYGTYFENTDFTDHGVLPNGKASQVPSVVRLDAGIDFDWRKSERPCGMPSDIQKDIGPDFFSVRWKGFVVPPHSGTWTFHVTRPAANDVKLLVNGLRVLASSPAASSGAGGAGGAGGAAGIAGTVALMAGVAYPISLEYRRYTAAGRLMLQWQHRLLNTAAAHVDRTAVPRSRLLTWFMPSSLCASRQPLQVKAGHACAGRSTVAGGLLSLATAGAPIAFVITSRDAFSNARPGPDGGVGAREWSRLPLRHQGVLQAVATSRELTLSSTAPGVAAAFQGMLLRVHDLHETRRIASYSSGRVIVVEEAFSRQPVAGLRCSIVDDDAALSGPALADYLTGQPRYYVRFVPSPSQTTYSRGSAALPTIHAIPERMSSTLAAGGLSATYYSLDGQQARAQPLWAAECKASGLCERGVDFSVAGGGQGRLRHYDARGGLSLPAASGYSVRWRGSLAVPRPGTYTFSVQRPASTSAQEQVRLWIDGYQVLDGGSNGTKGSVRLMHQLPATFPVELEYKSPSASEASGLQLLWLPPADPALPALANASHVSAFRLVPPSNLYALSGRHGVRVVPQAAGEYRTLAGLAMPGGLDATFYSDVDLQHSAATSTAQEPAVDLRAGLLPAWVRSSALANEGMVGSPGAGTARRGSNASQWLSPHSFSMRWQGVLRVGEAAAGATAAVLTFQAEVAHLSEDRLRLWVDDKLLIDVGGADAGGSLLPAPTGSISLEGGYFYPLRLEYAHRTVDAAAAVADSGGHEYARMVTLLLPLHLPPPLRRVAFLPASPHVHVCSRPPRLERSADSLDVGGARCLLAEAAVEARASSPRPRSAAVCLGRVGAHSEGRYTEQSFAATQPSPLIDSRKAWC